MHRERTEKKWRKYYTDQGLDEHQTGISQPTKRLKQQDKLILFHFMNCDVRCAICDVRCARKVVCGSWLIVVFFVVFVVVVVVVVVIRQLNAR